MPRLETITTTILDTVLTPNSRIEGMDEVTGGKLTIKTVGEIIKSLDYYFQLRKKRLKK